jgi:prolyl oligopeptidase
MNRSTLIFILKMCAISAVSTCGAAFAAYPLATRSPQVDAYFGEKVYDPYRWMEAIDSPETVAWIGAERAFTARAFDAIPERMPIQRRLRELWNYPRYGLPAKRAGRMFYTRNDGLQNQAVLYVLDGPGASPRVLIDPNLLSVEGTVAVTDISPSANGLLLGYGLAVAGSDWNEYHVRDVVTGKDLPDEVRWVKFSSLSWTRDGGGFYYCRFPEVPRNDALFGKLSGRQLFYHRLGTDQRQDRLIFEMRDHPDWFFDSGVSDDGRYVILSVEPNGSTETALYYMDLVNPDEPRLDAPVVRLLDKFDAEYTYVGNTGAVFYVETTLDAPRGRVAAIDLEAPAEGGWKTIVGQTEDNIDEAAFAGGRVVVARLHDVQSRLDLFAKDGSPLGHVTLPGIGAVSALSGRADDPELFYSFSSFLIPPSVWKRNLDTGEDAVVQQPGTPFDPTRFETKETFYTSRDGARIPMFITARKGLKLDRLSAVWLTGYGGFNISMIPSYSVPYAAWLDMGGVFAQANVRGGGEYGEPWHLAGTKERKQNVFDDFIAAADFLVGQGYTQRDRLVIQGRSNGGLLIGAVLNQRPDLCAVALPGVGVMDMLRYHTFTIGAEWASDYGTSADPVGFKYLRAYSPVHNVKRCARYPAVLIVTGDHDDRVFPAHSFKYAAEMQHAVGDVPGAGPVLIRIDSNTGHGGSSGTSPATKVIDEWSDEIAFAAHFIPAGTLRIPWVR